MTCRTSDKSESRPGDSHIVLVQPEQVFDRIVRAACGFESLYVRDGAVDFSTVRPREVYMRVSIAAGGRKTSRRDFFACFG